MFYVKKNGRAQMETADVLAALLHVQVEGARELSYRLPRQMHPSEYTVAQAIADGWEITTQPRQ